MPLFAQLGLRYGALSRSLPGSLSDFLPGAARSGAAGCGAAGCGATRSGAVR
ncbi:hypothetical protein QF030_003556 [Streptomyces rishiriensis]|uniref:Uncharacterized protein n=1 Tax=Streptomyces rishiriensis TaxID=68264 RepID=A0ABU0NRM5_STRRH|nr:hypothetical protein [Streptomyces rishiriensis]